MVATARPSPSFGSLSMWQRDVSLVDRPLIRHEEGRAFWEKSLPVIEQGKLVRGGMWDHQQRWWNLPTFIKGLVGGYGSGKTFIGAKRAISLALQNPGCMVAAVSPTFPLARKTIIPTIRALLAGKQTHYGSAFWWRFNKSIHEFHIRYKGRQGLIQVMSGEDPDALRGPNLAAAWLDEPFLMDIEVFRQMIARVRHPDALVKEINLTGTPEQLNWGYDLFMGEMKDDLLATDTTIGFIQASSRDNKATGADYIKRLEGAFTAKLAEAYIEGGFVNLSQGLVYYGFQNIGDRRNLIREEIVPPEAELGCGMDFNVNPMSASIFWKAGDRMHVFDEIELPNADTEFLCQYLYEKYVDEETRITPQPLMYVYPDASGAARKTSAPGGKTDFWYIKQAGFEIRAHHENPKRKDRYNAVNGKFRPKEGPITLTIDPACKKLVRYLLTHTYELMNKQQAMTHLLDAFSYPVEYLFPVTREAMGQFKLMGL